ncbi:thioredoxin family protein [Candidatus Woesearchaeota archaeon]|nr:MAG: thioredoxin family protein [Candidatus Woesearchaeota archaeon]
MVLLQSQQKLAIGEKAPDFSLKGVDGKTYTLSELEGNAFLIIFICNHCPYVLPKIETLKTLQDTYKDKGVLLIGINSNDPGIVPDDSFDNMQRFARAHALNFPYLFDETQDVARAYGAVCTPDPFLLDRAKKLAWHGRIDDALSPGQVPRQHDMDEAIQELLAKGKVTKPFLPSQGCSIKWKRHHTS